MQRKQMQQLQTGAQKLQAIVDDMVTKHLDVYTDGNEHECGFTTTELQRHADQGYQNKNNGTASQYLYVFNSDHQVAEGYAEEAARRSSVPGEQAIEIPARCQLQFKVVAAALDLTANEDGEATHGNFQETVWVRDFGNHKLWEDGNTVAIDGQTYRHLSRFTRDRHMGKPYIPWVIYTTNLLHNVDVQLLKVEYRDVTNQARELSQATPSMTYMR